MNIFNTQIHLWYSINKRDLPWRDSINPYFVWLSEIILQQTRIEQGLSYYHRFTDEFPTITDLADASEDKILKLWQGLGYYSRARNLHFTAKQIKNEYNGIFPESYANIRSLKGIGDYTAAAIASISFNLEYPAVDGNVYRVLSRYFGITEPIDSSAGKKIFNELATELIKDTHPGTHNQALMEFGALQCKPRNPDCTICPLNKSCYALLSQKIDSLPVKQKKTQQRDRYFNYLVLNFNNHIWLQKRIKKDIWKNLYEFPVIETKGKAEIENIIKQGELEKYISTKTPAIKNISPWRVHLLSHQRINYRFIQVQLSEEISRSTGLIKVNKEDIFNFATPKLLENYINEASFLKIFNE